MCFCIVFEQLANLFFRVCQAFDDEDPDAAKRALSSPFIKHMDVEYARLARDLPLPRGITTAPKANVIENAAPSYKSPNAIVSDEVCYER